MALKFEIVEGNLKITNTENDSVLVLFSKQNIGAMANIVVDATSPVILYNIAQGYNGIIFKDSLNNCVDSTNTPFTPETFLLFCELNLGFNAPGASGTITVTDSYLTLPAANTQAGKFYWCQNPEGVYLTGLYYSNGTTWETSEADEIKVVTNYSALPDPTTVPGQFYWCEASQGTKWLPGSLGGTYYNSGMYYSNGTSWTFLNVPYQATQAEVNAGLNDDKFVTPNTLGNSIWAFTASKVLATVLTGLSASAGTYTATDSILTAFNKLKYLLDNIATNTTPGIMKLYTTTGVNEDGSITQKSFTDGLNAKSDKKDLYVKSLTSDISTTSNVQLSTNLSFPIAANEIWTVEFNIMGGCASSGGIRITINAPSGATGGGGVLGSNNNVYNSQGIVVGTLSLAFGQSNTTLPQRIYVTVRNGITSGNVVFSFASASSGQTSILRANSYMIATKSILV